MQQDILRRAESMREGEDVLIPLGLRHFIIDRLYEAAGLIVLGMCFVIVLSLSGWSASDPSFSHAVDTDAENYLGYWGAVIADLLMQLLGLGSIGFLIPPLVWGMYLVSHGIPYRFWLRMVFWLLGIVFCSGFFSSLVPPSNWPLATGLGGVIGDRILSLGNRVQGLFFSGEMNFISILFLFLISGVFILLGCGLTAKRHEDTPNLLSPTHEDMKQKSGIFLRLFYPFHIIRGIYMRFREGFFGIWHYFRLWHHRIFFSDWEGRFFSFLSLAEIRRFFSMHRIIHKDTGIKNTYDTDGRIEPYLSVQEGHSKTLETHHNPTASPLAENISHAQDADLQDTDLDGASLYHPPITPRSGPARQAQDLSRNKTFSLPPISLLKEPQAHNIPSVSSEILQDKAHQLRRVLEDFGIHGDIINVRPGPVVTLYELEPAPGVKSSRVINLADDIARSMSALSTRVAVIAGRNVIGIELPNERREMVYLRELLGAEDYAASSADLTLALGKTIGGEPVFADLARMPHLLIAGTTGSGKSVGINTMILSLLYRLPANRCKLIMIDPKMLELSVYEGIPHLLTPVVTDPKKAVAALKWTVREMERRYHEMSRLGVRNIDGFNHRILQAQHNGEVLTRSVQTGYDSDSGVPIYEHESLRFDPLPYIVVMVDEMADLMMVAGKEIEGALQRLAQMARAAGIHLITATQRPSVDVITGTIKANLPTRISFQVTTKVDSRTILGEQGAEQLLGQGDMLYMVGGGRVTRLHGAFVSDGEVEQVVRFLRKQGRPDYLESVTSGGEESSKQDISGSVFDSTPLGGDMVSGGDMGLHSALETEAFISGGGSGVDEDLYRQACEIVVRDRKASTSYLQRRLQIGYNRAASLIESLEENGIVSMANHAGKRDVLIGKEQN